MIYSSLVLGALFLYMVYRPKKREPTRLKFRTHRNFPTVKSVKQMHEQNQERDLTVLFQFNGHTFEAFEVLGATPGSGPQAVEEAYKLALRRVHEAESELIDLAYRAILEKKP